MRNQKSDRIQIFVVCHKPAEVPDNPYLVPIQAGAALSDATFPGMQPDNTGDNISEKNRSYCELTAQYWAWKNTSSDYVGFFHYRRYLSFNLDAQQTDQWGNINIPCVDQEMVDQTGLVPETMRDLITSHDVIAARGRKLDCSVYEEYGRSAFQHQKDLDVAISVLKEKYPALIPAADRYLNGNIAQECNMFIMRREIFDAYAAFLFDVLGETERRIDTSEYDPAEYRVFGYIAERLCGIYCTYLHGLKSIRYIELAKTLIQDTEPASQVPALSDKDDVYIVTAANNAFAPYLDVFLRSLTAHVSPDRQYSILVLYGDITDANLRILRRSVADMDNVHLRFCNVSRSFRSMDLFVNQHLSVETYYRLILPQLLPEVSRVLYLDCDMIVNRDVAKLYDMDLKGAVIGACEDIDVAGLRHLNQNDWTSYASTVLGLSSKDRYFQAGVLVMDLDKIRQQTTSEKMLHMAAEFHYRCHDQDILNRLFKNEVCYLPQSWNVLMIWREAAGQSREDVIRHAPHDLYEAYHQARKDPYIVHFAGYQKPWHVVDCDYADYFWEYAKDSPYYSLILLDAKGSLTKDEENLKMSLRQKANVIQNRYFPRGTKRRAVIDEIYMGLHGKDKH